MHKTTELDRLGRMHYARACSRSQSASFVQIPESSYLPNPILRQLSHSTRLSRGVKNFRDYRGGQFVGFGSGRRAL